MHPILESRQVPFLELKEVCNRSNVEFCKLLDNYKNKLSAGTCHWNPRLCNWKLDSLRSPAQSGFVPQPRLRLFLNFRAFYSTFTWHRFSIISRKQVRPTFGRMGLLLRSFCLLPKALFPKRYRLVCTESGRRLFPSPRRRI